MDNCFALEIASNHFSFPFVLLYALVLMARASSTHIKGKPKDNRKGNKKASINAANRQEDEPMSKYGHHTNLTSMPFALQQLILDIFKAVFNKRFDQSLNSVIQEVKQHLFNRDFPNAFGKDAFLDAYAMRWSPSRALAYLDIIYQLQLFPSNIQSRKCGISDAVLNFLDEPSKTPSQEVLMPTKVVSLGGGAGAELVALAGSLNYLTQSTNRANSVGAGPALSLDVVVLDIADWSSVVARLHTGLSSVAAISDHGAIAAETARTSMVTHDTFRVKFVQQDLLKMDVSQLGPILEDCNLVTLMFTLNELYSSSMSATTNLLLSMTYLMQPGSLLLVVDSPGSYSTVDLGKDAKSRAVEAPKGSTTQKKYPVLWLLDHTLLEAADVGSSTQSSGGKQWEKLDGHESKWFRLPQGLNYPINLEDMRYQIHLYRRL